jgi:threonine aldolase
LIGNKDFIHKSKRVRKVMGGGMRQAGFLAAAGLYALKNNVERLQIDHQHAKLIEKTLSSCIWVKEVLTVETNIVVAILKDASDRDRIIANLNEQNIKVVAFGPGMIRFVTHLDISSSDVEYVCEILNKTK